MTKTIPKLNRLLNPASFLQINTIKGFKYIDLAGEIVNLYHKRNTPPSFQMGLKGLIIEQPIEKVALMRVSSENFWMKMSDPDSLDMAATIFTKEGEKVLRILQVEEINRVGWRNYFIHEFNDLEAQKQYFEKISPIEGAKTLSFKLEVAKGDLSANIGVEAVIKEDLNRTPAVMFDVDVFKKGVFKVTDTQEILKEIREYLSSEEGFLGVVNSTFK